MSDDPKTWTWVCDTCGVRFPEYHNGCVKCGVGHIVEPPNHLPPQQQVEGKP